MDLITAIKSGRPFRRRGKEGGYYRPDLYKSMVLIDEDILADDWEIEEPKVEITEKEFDEAVKESMHELYCMNIPDQFVVRMEPGVFVKVKDKLFGKKEK